MYSNMGSSSATENVGHRNEINQNKIQYASQIIKPSLFSSSNVQHQPFTQIVTTADPTAIPSTSNAFTSFPQFPYASSSIPAGFVPMSVPQSGVPWKCPEWMATPSVQPGAYMNFNGGQFHDTRLVLKRKAAPDMEPEIKTKQLITDEKMAAQLNGMHISSDFTAHNTNTGASSSSSDGQLSADNCESLISYPTSVQDIEEKLKRAQRITVADVVRKIQDEPLLPASIIERFEKPCKALVLWQPPPKSLTDLIVPKSSRQEDSSDDNDNQQDQDNNNTELMDLNNDIELDVDNEADMDMDSGN